MKKILKSLVSLAMIITTVAYITPVYAVVNKETVYSKLNANGKNYKTIVTSKEEDEIEQVESEKELPIDAKITYTLDDKEIKPEDLIGKSGKVTIKIEYINKSSKQVYINEKMQTMYTPFVVALGTIINNKNNRNIKVTDGGKIVENGDKTFVVGVVFPGLDESLNLGGNLADIKIPSYIEISMDSENFEMSNILTYATPKVFNEDIDWSKFDNLFDKVNELKNGIDKIEDGTNKLQDGTEKLDDGAKELSKGINAAYEGSKEIKKQVSNSIETIKKDKSKALDKDMLEKIGNKAGNSATDSMKKELNTIGNLAKNSATKTIESKEKEIGTLAKDKVEKTIDEEKNKILKQAETELEKFAKSKEYNKKIVSALKNIVENTMKSEAFQKIIANKMADALKNNEIVTKNIENATLAGVASVKNELNEIDKNVKADAGEAEDINVSIDYTKYQEYQDLDEDTQKTIQAIANKMKQDAEKQAEDQAKTAISKANKNAEDSAKQSAQKALKDVANTAAKKAAEAATKTELSSMLTQMALAGAQEGLTQVENALEENSDIISDLIAEKILPNVGGTVADIAKEFTGKIAEETAIQTAKTVAPQVAEQTAKTVAMQIAPTVASQTATTVADEVANEVKKVAMNEVKEKMTTLLNVGMKPLAEGLSKLDDGAETLKDGTKELNNGAKELRDGIHKFNSEGIAKISNFVNIDLKNLVTRGKKLEELAKEYNTFNSDKKRDDIHFISLVDSLRKKDENN